MLIPNKIIVSSLNVYGLRSKIKFGNLDDYVDKVDIFCVSESKSKTGINIDDFTIFNLENKTEDFPLPGIYGLQVYVKNHIANLCVQISDNNLCCNLVIWIKIADSFILGALYFPHDNSPYYDKELYEDFSDDISHIKRKYDLPLLLTGDFNSRTGVSNEIMMLETQDNILGMSHFKYPNIIDIFNSLNIPLNRTNKDTTKNKNGRDLIELCKLQELCIINGRIGSDKNVGDFTCAGASTVDYMICSPDLLHNIEDFTINIFDPLQSDKHCPIKLKIDLKNKGDESRPSSTVETSPERFITKCKWDNSKRIEFQNSFDESQIDAIYETLSSANFSDVSQASMDNITSGIKQVFMKPAEVTGMLNQQRSSSRVKKGKFKNPWFNNECKESKNNYKRYKKSLHKPLSTTEEDTLKNMAKAHKKLLRKEKRKFEKELNAKIRKLRSTEPGKYWSIINPRKKSIKIGNISLDEAWTHFRDLNKDNSGINDSVNDNEMNNVFINELFTIAEIRKHINSLKINKAPGTDFILNEFIKNCPDKLIYVIVLLFNMVLESGIIPTDWSVGIIKVLYKNKGDIDDINNYRGITLLSCLGKLFTSVINERLYNYLTHANLLGNEQAGFRAKHSTLDHIFALQVLSNFYIKNNKQLFCAFVDYSKAFDFVNRSYIWQKVLNSYVNGKNFNVIRNMYKNAKSHVSLKNTLSEPFPCQVGVRQGENLSPLLFAIFLNDFKTFLSRYYDGLTFISESIMNELNVYLNIFCLLYADDTLVLAENKPQLELALSSLYDYCKKWDLKINVDKTKVIIFSKGKIRRYKSFVFGDTTIDVVDDYVYLGTTFNYNGTFNKAKAKQVLQAKKSQF